MQTQILVSSLWQLLFNIFFRISITFDQIFMIFRVSVRITIIVSLYTIIYLLSKFESVKIYWLSVKFDWFKYLKRGYCKSVEFHWLFQSKLTDLTVKNIFLTDESEKINCFNSEQYFFTDESVKRKITDSISENLTDSDLESN